MPPMEQRHLAVSFSAGIPAIKTVGEPTIHGAVVTGRQGTGVITPIAAAVAAITKGLLGELHAPKGVMLTIGR